MSEEKIKVSELAKEFPAVPNKDMLRALRELGASAKSMAGSLTTEEAARVREHFAEQKQADAERSGSHPNVIVRRRRKDADKADAPEVTEAAPAAREEVAPPAEEKPAAVEAPAQAEPVAEAPAASPHKVEEKAAPEAAKAEPAEKAKSSKARVVSAARVISRPGEEEEKKPEPVVESKPEPVAEISPVAAALAAREAAARAEEKSSEKGEEKGAKAARLARPDASAMPEGSSAPTLPQRAPEARTEAWKDADASAAADAAPRRAPRADGGQAPSAAPQVRIISRPAPGSQPDRSTRPAGGRPGAPGGPRGDSAGRPPRPGGPRPSGPGGPRPAGGPRPGGFGQQPAAPASPTDTRDGQSKKKRLKGRRTVDFQQGDFGGRRDDDDSQRLNRGKGRRKGGKPTSSQATQPLKAAKRKIRVTEAIRVADMAHQMGLKANEIIKVLFGLGVMATINQALDFDTATLVASEFGYEVEKAGFSEDDYLTPKEVDAPETLKPRPPVVTIMGHVDHGKTSLLDAIRKSNVTSGEAGGITQHIGAYHVKTKRGEIVFLDTPGHEAFTAMRARGAQVTDLVILVVAADDGVMEQTREAINHARAAGVPIMVAVNKMDKPSADPDRVLRELAELGLQAEEWGGDTIVAKVAAKTRMGLDDLLEMVALQSEIMELKANPDKAAKGHIVEAKLDKGRGPVATVLIQEGTLRQGDSFVCGPFSGRVRALMNDQGKKVKEAGPSLPVEVQGFEGVPEAGEEFFVVSDEKLARRIADSRAIKQRERELASESRVTLETFLSQRKSDQETLTLNLVLKSDVQGSLEAITEALLKQSTDKVRINVVHGGTGAITESDILLASASQAIIIGFNVRPTAKIKDVAEHENVDIRFYEIIYKLVDDIKSAMAGLLAPVQREVYLGQAEVRDTFSVPKIGLIAGSYVADGKIARNAGVRLLRDGVVVYTGKISSLKRFKDDAREVVKGNECGVGLENFNDVKIGDIIEAFETVEEAATL
ncbi:MULTISPECIES: translation initiation factor IF-2 [Desulfovibrio]|uniref:Translation initiation factor IF-2 n=2 Tax=Desulfovibrio desulfuricans TaxID=876 RepID=IF2_DESDA|nr:MULTISPECIES: translation initiation factor IF-2 [Desulfovibrio]B8J1Y4.1 RecName: Full=Translation initiation factor IF-2 [Desulfovibrio desulfuricans ATCC 27774]ATD80039.1 translation initiation factor IF-2 [Desulfovibrio sp. G11]SFW28205.1 translation initiation factor IF-2 [Desulfovibrio desulfuricans]SPD35489.1 Translation initiation factor IF- 2 [Desulfovibrio sp. G11]